MDPHTDPALRYALRATMAYADELRALLVGAEGDIEALAHYTDELARVQRWIDGWPDSALPRARVEG